MTAGGWISMLVSVSFVVGLVSFCFYRVLTGTGGPPPDDHAER